MSTIIFEFKPGFPSIEERLTFILDAMFRHPVVTYDAENSTMNIKLDLMCNHLQAIIAIICDAYPVIGIVYVQ